ncbi:MAG TPA: 2-phospho-L-lactate guanylyltransferase [Candidatus Binataceae bacterium]|nr:2-phospho-L-lactate guanylyltransferase [Candidatus Binataceae bacterium]
MQALLIAAKELSHAKTRLASLRAATRIELARAMFEDVLAAAVAVTPAVRVAVISSDNDLLESARRVGAEPIDEGYPRGLNAAVSLASSQLARSGITTLATLLSDTPLISAHDIHIVLEAARNGGARSVTMVPSRDGRGTNVLVRQPAQVIAPRFGIHSLARHLAECERQQVEGRILQLAGPALDLDEMADLVEFTRLARAGRTLEELSRLRAELAMS